RMSARKSAGGGLRSWTFRSSVLRAKSIAGCSLRRRARSSSTRSSMASGFVVVMAAIQLPERTNRSCASVSKRETMRRSPIAARNPSGSDPSSPGRLRSRLISSSLLHLALPVVGKAHHGFGVGELVPAVALHQTEEAIGHPRVEVIAAVIAVAAKLEPIDDERDRIALAFEAERGRKRPAPSVVAGHEVKHQLPIRAARLDLFAQRARALDHREAHEFVPLSRGITRALPGEPSGLGVLPWDGRL